LTGSGPVRPPPSERDAVVLIRLLRTFLGRYRRDLTFVAGLQALQTFATLYLPVLNADIIDKGIATGDTGYIWRTGGLMLAVTLVQVVCSTGAVVFGSLAGMGFRPAGRRRLL